MNNILIPTNVKAVTEILDELSEDPFLTLDFLARLAEKQGVHFSKAEVSKALRYKYAEEASQTEDRE